MSAKGAVLREVELDLYKPPYHPAKYSKALLPVFWDICTKYQPLSILDPMAGVGTIGLLRDYGYNGRIVVNDLEPEWINQSPPNVEIFIGDAGEMTWANDHEFDAIITSPVYGNRMSDHHNARDRSRRYTYRHSLGRPLHPLNTGRLHWGPEYQAAHQRIWAECIRVLQPGGIFVLNFKNFFKKGMLIHASEWHATELQRQGLILIEKFEVKVPSNRHGANSALRLDFEDVWVFQK